MLSFREPQISDKEWVTEILSHGDTMGCEYTFGNIYMWSSAYRTKIGRFQDFFLSKSVGTSENGYSFPIGKGDLSEVIQVIIEDSEQEHKHFSFYNATKKDTEILNELYPNRFHISYQRGSSDYIYRVSDLADLPGKKYHSKRNHISSFIRDNNWQYEPITPDNLSECYEMNAKWEEVNASRHLKHIGREEVAIERAFDKFFELGLVGGLIRVDGEIVAYTVGEPINENVFCVHLEKAFADVRGAYPIINREFVRNTLMNYEYVNREEDLGLEGLRKAKLSYHPALLYDKYAATAIY